MRYALITQTPDSDSINPGTTLIANGIQYLIKQADPEAEFFFVCQDYHIEEEWAAVHRKADVLVFAGGPRINNHPTSCQYCDWDIWAHIEKVMARGIPVMDLFVGATHYLPLGSVQDMIGAFTASEKNRKILAHYKDMKLVTARDKVMSDVLSLTLGRAVPITPCASFWAPYYFGVVKAKWKKKRATDAAVIRHLPGNEWVLPKLCDHLAGLEEKGKRTMLIAHEQADIEWAHKHYPMLDIMLLDDSRKMLGFYCGVDRLISMRLHATIGALSVGAKVTNIAVDSSAVFTLEPFGVRSITLDEYREGRFEMIDAQAPPKPWGVWQSEEEFVARFTEAML